MADFRFKSRMIDADHVELTIVVPSPQPHEEVDLEGPIARKTAARWVLGASSGMAKTIGEDLTEELGEVYATLAFSVDRDCVLKAIRTQRCTPESLRANPPEGLDAEAVDLVLEYLLESQSIHLDGHLKCTDDN